jgi:hypothetical protein
MFEKYKAHVILGVREDASREDIEKRYYILTKKHLILKRENPGSEVPGLNMVKINEAYYQMIANLNDNNAEKLAIGSDISKKDRNIGFYFLLSRLGIDREKAENFFYYYKNHIIISIVLLVIILTMLFPISLGNGDEAINIVIFGNRNNIIYNELSLNKLEDGIKKKLENILKNINDLNIEFLLIDEKLILPDKINMMINAYNFVTSGDYHILIMDRESFNEYGIAADIAKLDDIVKELGIKKNDCYSLKLYGNEKEYIYGLNIDNSVTSDIHLEEECLIVVMREKFKKSKLHINIIKALMS